MGFRFETSPVWDDVEKISADRERNEISANYSVVGEPGFYAPEAFMRGWDAAITYLIKNNLLARTCERCEIGCETCKPRESQLP
jgi:hypothetical protein